MAATNKVLNVFQKYQKARVDFAQSVAELATRPQNVDLMQNAGVMGRMANYSEQLAQSAVRNNVLPDVVKSLNENALPPLRNCLESIDPTVKEAAVWCYDYIAQHNAELAKIVANEGVIPLIVLCLEEPELPLRRIAACCLSDLVKHDEYLAQKVVDTNALNLKRQVCACLAQIVKHSDALAQKVMDEGILPSALQCMYVLFFFQFLIYFSYEILYLTNL
eukprot:GSMAST32.ASY1.ANO1.715.1 assembled CDS